MSARPEVGRQYHIASLDPVRVRATRPDTSSRYDDVIVTVDCGEAGNCCTQELPSGHFEWTEVEPEYVPGALYEAADGHVFLRINDDRPWRMQCVPGVDPAEAGRYRDDYPQRPLTRLYREGER